MAPTQKPTVQDLVDQNKVVLDVLFVQFAEVGLHRVGEAVQKLENHCGIDIVASHGAHPDISTLDVKEGSAGNVCHRRSYLEIESGLDKY
jgi:hypothetical protein